MRGRQSGAEMKDWRVEKRGEIQAVLGPWQDRRASHVARSFATHRVDAFTTETQRHGENVEALLLCVSVVNQLRLSRPNVPAASNLDRGSACDVRP